MDGEISHADGWADAPPILFLEAPKRECAAPGGREKALRRVGLRQRRPPAAGGGWLAVPCGSQGRKRPALGEAFGPGKSGIHPAPLFAAAGRWSMRAPAKSQRNSLCECPGQRVAKRNARKEEQIKCVLAPRRPGHHPPRDGSIDLAEGQSVPEGKAKSALAPIRRPPSRGGLLHRSAPTLFSLDRARPVSLLARQKRNGGCIPAWTMPPAGAGSPPAAGRRLLHTPWRVHCPAINIAAIPRPTGRLRPSSIPKISKF